MRRRRNAASADDENVVPDATSSSPIIDSTPVLDPEPEPAKTRRRSPRAKVAAAPVEEAPLVVEPETVSEPAPVAEKPRRTRKPRVVVEETVVPEPTVVVEPVAVEPEVRPVVPAESASRRRRSRPKAEPLALEDAQAILAEVAPEAPIIIAAAEPVAASEPEKSEGRSGNRRRRGRGGNKSAVEPTPEPEVAESADDDAGKSRRTRGLRRTRTVAAPTLMVSGDEPRVYAPPVEEPEEAPVAEADSRRIRGRQRRPPVSVVAALLPPPIAGLIAPLAEPLPPVYVPLPAEVLANLVEAKVAVRKGVAELLIGGEPRLPMLCFVNTEMGEEFLSVAQRQIRFAYEAGVRLFTVLCHLPWKTRSGERRFDLLDSVIGFVAENAPEALVLPRLIFSPPASWVRQNPGEMVRYASGEQGDVSLGSRLFWEGEAEEALRAAVEHVAQGPHASRVFGFYLEHGEWLHEKGVGYDLSDANVAAFRSWLRARYKNSVVAFRAAWYSGSVSFETVQIPSWPVPSGPGVFLSPKEAQWSDFHRFMSERVAEVINRLAKAVKEASGGRSAVAVSCGYTLELARTSSGHLALAEVLASPHVDILTAPLSYNGRLPGGAAPLPLPIESVALAGKLCILEDDTKTFLASGTTPDTYNPHVPTVEGTRAVHVRNFGAALAHGAGISYMDLWGEGWLDDRETWEFLGGLREIAELYATRRRNPRVRANADPDVAVIVDEASFFDVRDERLLEKLISEQRDVLLRSGARIGFYLQSDLLRKNFPESPRLLIFLNAFRIEPAVRAAIRERWQEDGRTLAWIFTPGVREESLAEQAEVFGMHLKFQPFASKLGSRVFSDARLPLTEALRGQKLGDEVRVNPTLTVSDSRAQVVAEYGNGNGSLAVRKHPRWQSVFIGEPVLTQALLRGLYRQAGVPIYAADDDVAWVGDGMLCLHSAPGGGTTVYLPEDSVLHDFVYGETLARDGRGARLSMPVNGTRLLYFGPTAEAERFGAEPIGA
uniref:beta-galactosidase n=1 Tax=Armatimonas sp. TaxID=1872638 RepID=UPI00286B22D3